MLVSQLAMPIVLAPLQLLNILYIVVTFLKSEFFISIVSTFVAPLNRNARLVDDVASQFRILIVFGLLLKNDIDNSILQETLTSSTIVLSK